jgi:hypothetical protein
LDGLVIENLCNIKLRNVFTTFSSPTSKTLRKKTTHMKPPTRATQKLLGKRVRPKTRLLLERAIEVSMLPPLVARGIAADFVPCSIRTLIRAEKLGQLTAIRRGQQNVSYERSQFLRWVGLTK